MRTSLNLFVAAALALDSQHCEDSFGNQVPDRGGGGGGEGSSSRYSQNFTSPP